MSSIFTRRSMLSGATAFGSAVLFAPLLANSPKGRFFGPGGERLGLQLYTLGDEAQNDIAATFEAVRSIGYEMVELLGWGRNTAAEIKAALVHTGLTARSMQTTFQSGPLNLTSGFDKLTADANELDLEYVVASIPELPSAKYGGPKQGEAIQDFLSRLFATMTSDDWMRYAETLNKTAARLKPHGLKLAHHNHNVEFTPVGGTTAYDILHRNTDPGLVYFEMDAGWVKASGNDPVTILKRYPGRFRLLHVKDVKSTTVPNYSMRQDPAIVGTGVMDWMKILPVAKAAGITGYFVEQEPPFTMPRIDAARKNYEYLSRLKV